MLCAMSLPPGHPADTAHSFILFRRDGVASLKILGQAVHIHEPAVTGHNIPPVSYTHLTLPTKA